MRAVTSLNVVVKDHRNVVPVTREFVAKHNLRAHHSEPGDFLVPADYADDCDLISYITPLHWYLRDDVIKTLKYVDALPSGGAVLIVGYMLNNDRIGPLDSATTICRPFGKVISPVMFRADLSM